MADQDWDNFNWDSFESDNNEYEMDREQRMLRAAMENTYMILTGKATWDTLMEKASRQSGSIDQHSGTAILFNPMNDDYDPKFPHLHNDVDGNELIDSMIEFYVETEEYEKCAELTNYRKKLC
tara:strand:+ start:624 stop:992 length:369 start_codon:yes stop_codon:yes gene_type:complete